jgi:hypothetical protein
MTESEEFFIRLAEEIPGVMPGKMFGARCMKMPNGRASAMYWKECIVVKLQGDTRNEAMSLDGSCLFEPMEGRPMKEWVQIPYHYKHLWKSFAAIASENVAAIEINRKPGRK